MSDGRSAACRRGDCRVCMGFDGSPLVHHPDSLPRCACGCHPWIKAQR